MPAPRRLTDEEFDALPDEVMPSTSAKPAPRRLTDEEFDSLPEPEEGFAPSKLESIGRGARQGSSFGFMDEAQGAVRSIRDVVDGPTKLKDIISKYREIRDKERELDEKARQENPKSFMAGEIAGAIGTAWIPGFGWANAARGAGLASKLLTAAKAGGVMGAGTSESDLTKGDNLNFAEDVAGGAASGLVAQGLLSGAGAALSGVKNAAAASKAPVGRFVGKKAANFILNTPEELTEKYIQNPQGVKTALKRFELSDKFQKEGLDRLKKEVVEGSDQSRKILAQEGKSFTGDRIADIYENKAKQLEQRSEGVWSDPEQYAAYKWLKDAANKFRGVKAEVDGLPSETGSIPKILSTNRIKDELQSIDRQANWETAPGRFSNIDDRIKKDVRSQIDSVLKSESPAYADVMKGVAADTDLLKRAESIAKSPQGFANMFRRLETDQYGAGQIPKEILKEVDTRLNTNFVNDAELSYVKEAFDKSVTNGSMNVNKFSQMFKNAPVIRDIPGLRDLGWLAGAYVDKYGRKVTMSVIDMAISANKILQEEGAQAYTEKVINPLIQAASQGNARAALTLQLLSKKNTQEKEDK